MANSDAAIHTAEQVVDGLLNPLASILNQLLAILAAKGVLTKEEAIGCVASAADALEDDRIGDDAGEAGRDMLIRMIQSLDRVVEPERPITGDIGAV